MAAGSHECPWMVLGKSVLTPGFVDRNCRGVGEIEASATLGNRDPNSVGDRVGREQIVRQAVRLAAEEECVARLVPDVRVQAIGMLGEGEQALRTPLCDERIEGQMCHHVGELAVVEARPSKANIVEVETQWFDEMQLAACVDRQTHQIARVGRYLGSPKNYIEHITQRSPRRAFSNRRRKLSAGSFDWTVLSWSQCSWTCAVIHAAILPISIQRYEYRRLVGGFVPKTI